MRSLCKAAEGGRRVGEDLQESKQWIGPDVIFIAIAVEFVSDSSTGRNRQNSVIANSTMISDLSTMVWILSKDWDVSATPSYFLVQPDGIVAWNSGVDKVGWDAKEQEPFAITNDDRRVKLNEAIEQLRSLTEVNSDE